MPCLILNPDADGSHALDLELDICEIGSKPDTVIRFYDISVSDPHSGLTVDGEHCVLMDLDSTNRAFVRGRRVTEFMLHAGHAPSVGMFSLGGC